MAGIGNNNNNQDQEENQEKTNWVWYRSNTNTNDNNNIWQNIPPEQQMLIMHHHQQPQPQRLDLYNPTHHYHQIDASDLATSSSRSNTINCRDCGNQAKKDCTHMRCRTCCKSRGFDCSTHVRSTWIPVARRRDRQQPLHILSTSCSGGCQGSGSSIPKRHRDATLTGTSTSRLPSHPPGLEIGDASLPAEVSSDALFRCVKMSSVDDEEGDGEYAYQTTVNIGGHLFKGILYDQGPENSHISGGSGGSDHQSSSVGGGNPFNTPAVADGGGGGGGGSSAMYVDPNSGRYYPSNMTTMFVSPGTQFYQNPPKY
ncbi:unnamed protein product [Cochlearia groenlandica]